MEQQSANVRPRESCLTKRFGEEPSMTSWLTFKSHFKLIEKANVMNGVSKWQDEEYKAIQMRLQFDGEVEQWLTIAENSDESWMNRSDTLMEKMISRYETAEGLEIKIKTFEESTQADGESIENYFTRLRKAATYAFSGDNADSVRGRVIWKFISGVNNDFIRQELLRKKWVGDDNKAKSYDEILNNALSSEHLYKATTVASRQATTNQSGAYYSGTNRADQQLIDRLCEKVDNLLAVQQSDPRTFGGNYRDNAILCWYCQRHHPGGYKRCFKRNRESPQWVPRGIIRRKAPRFNYGIRRDFH